MRNDYKARHALIVRAIVCDERYIVEERASHDPRMRALDPVPACLRCHSHLGPLRAQRPAVWQHDEWFQVQA
jgi:hypothetical protein